MNYKYNFGVKDREATTARHADRIKKVKANIKFKDVLDYNSECEIESQTLSSGYYQYRLSKLPKGQQKAKEITTAVNYKTREIIRNTLEWLGFPKSWDTAFYMAYYTKTNWLMTRIAKDLI